MEEKNKQQNIQSGNSGQQGNSESNIQGRVENTRSRDFEEEANKADISHVDRQEGSMNNGMIGGNFGEDKDEEQ